VADDVADFGEFIQRLPQGGGLLQPLFDGCAFLGRDLAIKVSGEQFVKVAGRHLGVRFLGVQFFGVWNFAGVQASVCFRTA
jgi:hypothetical protein